MQASSQLRRRLGSIAAHLTAPQTQPTRLLHSSPVSAMAGVAKVGDQLPDVTLHEGQPNYGAPKEVRLRELFAGKKGILFAVPGAFTPGCSKSHVPSYVQDYDLLLSKGVEVIVCTATNDAYVMYAWGVDQKVGNKIRMLSDKDAKLATALGVANQSGCITRSGRYSAVVVDNKLASFNLQTAGGDLACTLSNVILSQV